MGYNGLINLKCLGENKMGYQPLPESRNLSNETPYNPNVIDWLTSVETNYIYRLLGVIPTVISIYDIVYRLYYQ